MFKIFQITFNDLEQHAEEIKATRNNHWNYENIHPETKLYSEDQKESQELSAIYLGCSCREWESFWL